MAGSLWRTSVREMVEFICRSGDLESGGFRSPERAVEGTRAHQKLQKKRGGTYVSEVPLSFSVAVDGGGLLQIDGRADGRENLFLPEDIVNALQRCANITPIEAVTAAEDLDHLVVLEEIKSTYAPPERLSFRYDSTHWAQLACYGHILCEQEDLPGMLLTLTYYQMENDTEHSFREWWTAEELRTFFESVVREYIRWLVWEQEHTEARNAALETLSFPFPEYREGQRTMAAYVYKTIAEKSGLFLQAPTGIGKTISAVFPALKAMQQGLTSKVFYLTAKTAASSAARDTLRKLEEQHPGLAAVLLTAKDKICPLEERNCSPDACPYAKGHYDRILAAVREALAENRLLVRADILEIAEKHQVCPFELQLDISTWCDVIIGDYNYAFDPAASLKRFFQDRKTDYALLVDEAHNLPDRAMEMFSADLYREPFVKLQQKLRSRPVKYRQALRKKLSAVIFWLDEQETALVPPEVPEDPEWGFPQPAVSSREGVWRVDEEPAPEFLEKLEQLRTELADYLMREGADDEEALDLYFQTYTFLRTADEMDDGYVTYLHCENGEVRYRLYCVHPSGKLSERYQKVGGVVLFSATMLPIEYYREMLGGNDPEHPMEAVYLPSPFDPEHLCVAIPAGIQANYQSRGRSASEVAAVIYRTISAREGNYMVYFPSYPYLRMVAEEFARSYPGIPFRKQEAGMTEEEKEEFLASFGEEPPWQLGFGVLGGSFSEGIDLAGERLIGCIVVSLGLPQICLERNLIRNYMESTGKGFDFAYLYPGLNKVFQAAGRVIRTKEDRGVVVLVDDRFRQTRNTVLFPKEWRVQVVKPGELGRALGIFWEGKPECSGGGSFEAEPFPDDPDRQPES